jgi:alkanesulfonate monooxygenase
VKIGAHICDFTFPGGPSSLAADIGEAAQAADEAGFARISVMDHVWQIGVIGPPEHEMLEAYTTLGYLAAKTQRAQLLAWVTAVVYRSPGLLAKCVTTLDVLSEGRAVLGIGAAWNDEESAGLGLHFPPTAERFERLEETLQIMLQMWSDSEEPYDGKHYHLGRTLNAPQSLSKPHPPILIGGGGEKKTLRLVAQYADACNLFDIPELPGKLDVLREHCAAIGRNYASIEKTVNSQVAVPAADGAGLEEYLAHLEELNELGIQHVHTRLPTTNTMEFLELFRDKVLPEAAKLTPPAG